MGRSKSKPSAGVKQKSNGKRDEDFILTIDSDSENEAPVLEELSSEEEEEEVVNKGKGKKKVEDKKVEGDDEAADEINPDFQFSLDGMDSSSKFDGWDFQIEEKGETAEGKKEVNLDEILKRKGGLLTLAGSDKKKDIEEEEEEQEEEDDDEEESEVEGGEDEDELALDGFGMGAEGNSEDEEDEEDEEEDEEHEEHEEEEEQEEMEINDVSDEEKEEDTAEQMAEFYADKEEAEKAEKLVHQNFQSLKLSRPVLKGLAQLGYTKPSPIQSASIPISLLGKDIVAGAVTGSGKTAAYMIPIIERLLYKPTKVASTRVVVLTPTRELAIQVGDVGKKIGRFVNNLNFGLAVGGLNLRQQEQQLKTRPDIVIATPGRLIDHIRNSASFSIDSLEVLVIDEADRMLEEGFQAELTEILSLIPKHKRQTLLFSATMNTKIQDLIQLSLDKPVRIMIDPPKSAATKLVQEFIRIRKREHLKPALLFHLLKILDPNQQSRIVVFVARKETAHRLRVIIGLLGMKVSELHGSLTQEQRLQSVNDFKNLTVPVLVCTDLAARGLDIPKIEIVINFDMPKSHEIYLHRVGRTARAGREGKSITFVGESTQDRSIVKASIKSLEEAEAKENKPVGKAVSRNVDWKEVENLNKIVEAKESTIEEVLQEEKEEKEILQAELQLAKASNLVKYEKEIQSRPKRTWFESEKDKKKHSNEAIHQLTKHGKKLNSHKRKAMESRKENGRSYKKTKTDRMASQGKARNVKVKGKGKRK